jgi:signal transduction histidine kinase
MDVPGRVGAGARRSWVRSKTAGVRRRLVLVATALVALALAVGAAVMLLILREALVQAADRATEAKAHELVSAIDAGGLNGFDRSLLVTSDVVDLVQVVGPGGAVLFTSDSGGRRALRPSIPEPGETTAFGDIHIGGGNTEYRGVAIGMTTEEGPVAVEVATSEGRAREVVLFVFVVLCCFFPIVLALVAWSVFWLVGRTLRPVEQIRTQVSELSTNDLSARVTVSDSGDEIAALAGTMNLMLDRLEDAYARQLQFMGDASHELRSPLVTLVGIVDLAIRTQQPIDVATADEILKPEISRLSNLITDLLLLARSDEQGLRASVDVDLDELVDEEIRRTELSHGVSIPAAITPARIRGDPQSLSSMLRNVLENAMRYATANVVVRMVPDYGLGVVRVEVSDDGPGIPDEARERIFDRFVRLDPDRDRRVGGAGLGLAIVREIAHAHGGRAWAAGSDMGGTRIVMELPLSQQA